MPERITTEAQTSAEGTEGTAEVRMQNEECRTKMPEQITTEGAEGTEKEARNQKLEVEIELAERARSPELKTTNQER